MVDETEFDIMYVDHESRLGDECDDDEIDLWDDGACDRCHGLGVIPGPGREELCCPMKPRLCHANSRCPDCDGSGRVNEQTGEDNGTRNQ